MRVRVRARARIRVRFRVRMRVRVQLKALGDALGSVTYLSKPSASHSLSCTHS